jgi:hypothetical protein
MIRIWKFFPRLPDDIDKEELGGNCAFLNWEEVFAAGLWVGRVRSPLPVVQLKLTLESFEVDCFSFQYRTLVSRRLRDAMALDPSAVQYFDVDASQSAPKAKAMDYKVLNVSVTEDVTDQQSSNFRMGSLMPGGPSVVTDLQSIAFRRDAQPKHPLFCDRFFAGHLFCTDDLALRVLRAGCTGIQFLDTAQLHFARAMRYRTVQGVEESVWDPEAEITKTRLVEEIN